MTDEIKERIEKVNSKNIPNGYTWSWHLMPLEWTDVPLSHIFLKKRQKNKDNIVDTVFTNSAVNGITLQSKYFEKDIAHLESTEGYYVVEPEDYVYNPRISENAPYGPFKRNNTGITGIVSPLYTVLAPKSEYRESEFLSYYFDSAQWYKYAYSIANYGARFDRMNITDQELMGLPVVWPSLPEQQKIAEILLQCDKVVELYQSEIGEMKKLKKAYLQKLFPQQGSKIPEIRFSGFNNPWEQRKLEDVFDMTISNNTFSRAELNYNVGEVQSIHYGDVLIKYGACIDVQSDEIPYITGGTLKEYRACLLQDGDIIFADTAEDETTGKAAEIGNLQGKAVVSGLHTIVCRPIEKMAKYYLGYYLNSDSFHNQLLPLMQGIKVLSLSRSSLAKTVIKYPVSKEEQAKIGSLFHGLDHLITLHLRKLEEMQRMKRALMQLLLTGVIRVST